MNSRQHYLTAVLYFLSGLLGLLAFAAPFLLPALAVGGETAAHQADAPLVTTLLLMLCLAVLMVELQGQTVSAKMVSTLGILVAITAVLRFVETAVPGPVGFSPIFAPILLSGYVFGPRFGFLMGSLSLLVSGLITGGIGPWLPYQMFACGWVGLTAGWLPHPTHHRWELGLLVGMGFFWGLAYGAIMNLYFWPYVTGGVWTWEPGLSWGKGFTRYAAFYGATSLLWDASRGMGNAILLLAVGTPAIQALTRFRDRFQFQRIPLLEERDNP